ncbi:hypothetical protein F5888DRAFT_889322 [Russula emetica]|nr:hypothetical protein F5888DRAFT_889322 [Russula emetica]
MLSSRAHPSYPEGSLQHPPSGQGYGSRSPYAAPVPFPEPQYDGSASHPQAHIPPSQTTQNLTVATHHQHERRGSHGHSPATGWSGSSSDGQRLYPAGTGSDTGGGSKFYSGQPGVEPHHGGGYTATAAQPQDWNAAVYNEGHDSRSNAAGHGGIQGHGPRSIAPGVPPVGSHRRLRPQVENAAVYDEGHGSRPKSPPHHVTSGYKPLCRYPRCGHHVFFDRRVNELREWCSDQHMQCVAPIHHNPVLPYLPLGMQ